MYDPLCVYVYDVRALVGAYLNGIFSLQNPSDGHHTICKSYSSGCIPYINALRLICWPLIWHELEQNNITQ